MLYLFNICRPIYYNSPERTNLFEEVDNEWTERERREIIKQDDNNNEGDSD